MKKFDIEKVDDFKSTIRIICISDVHGNLSLLKTLIGKLNLSKDDKLFFLGDMVEKGDQSMETIEYLMKLEVEFHAHFICGNNDLLALDMLEIRNTKRSLECMSKPQRKNSLLSNWAASLGHLTITEQNIDKILKDVNIKFKKEIDWMKSKSVAIYNSEFIFTHSGIEDIKDWKESSLNGFMKNNLFYKQHTNMTGKWLIVGHMPTYNISEDIPTNNFILDKKEKVVFIDGGCNVKAFSQLNALIITKNDVEWEFSQVFADNSEQVVANCDYTPDFDAIFMKMDWENLVIEILEKGDHFSLCRIESTGKIGHIKNEHIMMKNNHLEYGKCSCSNMLTIKNGEPLLLLDNSCSKYAYVKKIDGTLGWVSKQVL